MSDDGFFSRWARRKAQVQQRRPDEPAGDPSAAAERGQAPQTAKLAAVPAVPLATGLTSTPSPRTRADTTETAGPAGSPATGPATGPAAGPTGPAAPARVDHSADHPAAGSAAGGTAAGGAADAPAQAPPAPTLDDVAQLDRDAPDYSRFVARNVQPDVRNAALKKLFTDPHFNVMDRLDIYIDDYGRPDPLPEGMLARLAQGQFLGLFSRATEDAAATDPPAGGTVPPDAPATPAAATQNPEKPQNLETRASSYRAQALGPNAAEEADEPEDPAEAAPPAPTVPSVPSASSAPSAPPPEAEATAQPPAPPPQATAPKSP